MWCRSVCSQSVTTFAEIRLVLSIDFPPFYPDYWTRMFIDSMLTDISATVRSYFQYVGWGCLLACKNAHVGEFLPTRHFTDEQIASRL